MMFVVLWVVYPNVILIMGYSVNAKSVGLYVCYSRLRQDFNSEILMSINDSICEGDNIALV